MKPRHIYTTMAINSAEQDGGNRVEQCYKSVTQQQQQQQQSKTNNLNLETREQWQWGTTR